MKRKKHQRRRRTNSQVPALGRLRDMADQLWSSAVRIDWNHRCAVCGAGKCESHHLIPRQWEATRYELRNGIALCATHHQFDPDLSPHQNAAGWLNWLEKECHELRRWYEDTVVYDEHKEFTGTKNAAYYCDVIRSLRQYVEPEEFERICGVGFSAYLEEQE